MAVRGRNSQLAIDRYISSTAPEPDQAARMTALLAQLDRVPDRIDALDPMVWDERGICGSCRFWEVQRAPGQSEFRRCLQLRTVQGPWLATAIQG